MYLNDKSNICKCDGWSWKVNVVKLGGVFLDQTSCGEGNWTEVHSRRGQQKARRMACKGGRKRLVWQDDRVRVIRALTSRWKSLLLCPYLPYCIHRFCFIPNSISQCCLDHLLILNIVFLLSASCFYTVPVIQLLGLNPGSSTYQWANYLTSLCLSSFIFKEEIIMGQTH